MIRVVASTSGVSARAYFRSGLARADYYTDEILGKWHGKAAATLGLTGEVKEEQFARLLDNHHPTTGDKLNPRVNTSRTVGWDINFHAPKSFSLALSLGNDPRLLQAFRDSVQDTMADIEAQTQTRVRIHGADRDRDTGNLCWAEFVHLTARPIGGIPDPHTHVHAYVFNTTFDPTESRWKAAKIQQARRDLPLHQARFHARLALRTKALGYQVQRTRSGWEIAGMPRPLIDKFSRRTAEIERLAREQHLTDPEKDKLGALTRQGKRRGLTETELTQAWQARLTPEDITQLQHTRTQPAPPYLSAKQALDHAFEKLFARDAVVRRNRLLAEALRYGVGQVTPEAIEAEYRTRKVWEKQVHGDLLLTHDEVLAEEISLVTQVRAGKGRYPSLVPGSHRFRTHFLSDEQQAAVSHILHSHDRVIAVRGGAGTGKTTAMQEAVAALESHGHTVLALAPSADASRDTLREAGFPNAETAAHYLANPKLQQQTKGQVLWIDEASLLGTRDLHALLQTAGPDTRILLTGDTRQHAPVARGDAFRTLQQFAGLRPAEITRIRRQKPETYREAVSDLSKGDLPNAFLKLDAMGALREIPDREERHRQLAQDYLTLSLSKTAPLVVSPTRAEGRQVTAAIREKLFEAKRLRDEHTFPCYRNLHWETAEKREPEHYSPGLLIQYHQNGKGVKRGQRLTVTEITPQGDILVQSKNETPRPLNLTETKKFQVFAHETISLAHGDRIRLTRNGFSRDGRRHSNGNLREIEGFTPEGHLRLTTGAILDKNDGHWTHGYCTTSHASQSKSVKDVLIAQSSDSFAAASREQFYVSVSRGKERVQIYTDDRTALQEAVGISAKRRSALELAKATGRDWNALLEKELDREGWRKTVAKKGTKEAAREFLTKLHPPKKSSPTNQRWTDYLTQRRGYGEFRSPNAPRHLHPKQTTQPSKTPRPQPERTHLLRKFTAHLKSAQEWMTSTRVLRNAQRIAQQRIRQIRAFTHRHADPAKTPVKTSLKPVRTATVQRPAIPHR
ncbi:MAG: conjugal transfer protein [Verrucomicrobiales bacterium]|nr:conjugal transfer protein [Verrucomicrobiales bacterium]